MNLELQEQAVASGRIELGVEVDPAGGAALERMDVRVREVAVSERNQMSAMADVRVERRHRLPAAADAEVEIRARFGTEVNTQRLRMGEFPRDSRIIPNPYNRIPGFSLGDHHFLPGFPQMAWPMMEWVLDHHYRELQAAGRIAERALIVRGAGESQLISVMNACLERFPGLKVFSLPHMSETDRYVELGVRGDALRIPAAIAVLREGVSALGFEWTDLNPGV